MRGKGAPVVGQRWFPDGDLPPEPPRGEQKDELETRSFSELILARDAASVAELNWRLSPALAVIILGLLAIPLSHAGPREGRGARAALGILVDPSETADGWIGQGTALRMDSGAQGQAHPGPPS